MALFAAFADSVGLRKLIERSLQSLVRTSPNALTAAGLLLGVMVGFLTGASHMLHLELLRADSSLRTMFSITRLAAPTAYARFIQSLRGQFQVYFWETVMAWALVRLPDRPLGYRLEIDSTVVECFREQDVARSG